jgi:beta-galactosidase
MMYFRYRGATKGAEQFCYGVIDSDNQKRRKFYEVQSFFKDISQYQSALDSPIHSDVAILYDYDSLSAFRIQSQSILLDPSTEMQRLYKVFYDLNIMVDVIPSSRDISNYKVVILPQMVITDETITKKVETYVQNGGKLIMTYRTAVKDRDNNLVLNQMLPIGYNALTGVTVEETESLQDYDAFPLEGQGICSGSTGYGGIFRDMLVTHGAEVLYHYSDQFYTEYASITRNAYGNGSVYYIGCTPDSDTLNRVVNLVIDEANIPKVESPNGVEVVNRGNSGDTITMVINHNSCTVEFNGETLNPFECRVVR